MTTFRSGACNLMLVAVVALSACHGAPKTADAGATPDALIGQWVSQEFRGAGEDDFAAKTLYLHPHGTYRETTTLAYGRVEESEGFYRLTPEGLVIENTELHKSALCPFELEGDRLTMLRKVPQGWVTVVYRRVY